MSGRSAGVGIGIIRVKLDGLGVVVDGILVLNRYLIVVSNTAMEVGPGIIGVLLEGSSVLTNIQRPLSSVSIILTLVVVRPGAGRWALTLAWAFL